MSGRHGFGLDDPEVRAQFRPDPLAASFPAWAAFRWLIRQIKQIWTEND